MNKDLKRKFREHDISVANFKKFKADMGQMGTPKQAGLRDPLPQSHTMLKVKVDWSDVIMACRAPAPLRPSTST